MHQFFIDNLNSEEIIIPWSIQHELTIDDLVYIAIKMETSNIKLDQEFNNHFHHRGGKEIYRLDTETLLKNATITIILYCAFKVDAHYELITINASIWNPDKYINELDEVIADELQDRLKKYKLSKSKLYITLKKFYYLFDEAEIEISEEDDSETTEEGLECWNKFIKKRIPTQIKSARKV